jgi:hypothetical protein
VGLIDLAKARLEADGWRVSPAGPSLRAATGILLVGHKPGPRERVLVCPECGGEVEPALYEVARGEGLAPTWGWACPTCGWLGLEDDLPKERGVRVKAWDKRELAEVLKRPMAKPAMSSEEEERRKRERAARRVEEILDEVRSAPPGGRNNVLARGAAALGALLARYEVMSLDEAEERLVEAALEAGLTAQEARSVARRQLRWGYERGA